MPREQNYLTVNKECQAIKRGVDEQQPFPRRAFAKDMWENLTISQLLGGRQPAPLGAAAPLWSKCLYASGPLQQKECKAQEFIMTVIT